jgi:hypothetical protein
MLKRISWTNGNELRNWQVNAVSQQMRGFLAAKDFVDDLIILELGGLGSRMGRIPSAYVMTPLEDFMDLNRPSSRQLLDTLRTANRMCCYVDHKDKQIRLILSIHTPKDIMSLDVSFLDNGTPLSVSVNRVDKQC